MNTRITGIVLRAKDRHLTAQFYAALGLEIAEHVHGGPIHYMIGPIDPKDFVTEVYTASEKFDRDAIMVELESIQDAIEETQLLGSKQLTEIKDTGPWKFAYITDPDGRPVMLIEKK